MSHFFKQLNFTGAQSLVLRHLPALTFYDAIKTHLTNNPKGEFPTVWSAGTHSMIKAHTLVGVSCAI